MFCLELPAGFQYYFKALYRCWSAVFLFYKLLLDNFINLRNIVQWKYLVYTKDYAKDSDIICLPVYMTPFI